MRIDSLDLFDTTKSVIHEHDETRKKCNMVKRGIILLKGDSSRQRDSVESFLIIPHPSGRGFKEPGGGMPHSALIGRALLYRARSASTGVSTPTSRLCSPSNLASRDLTGGADPGARLPAAGSLHRAGCEDGRAGQRQDPFISFPLPSFSTGVLF